MISLSRPHTQRACNLLFRLDSAQGIHGLLTGVSLDLLPHALAARVNIRNPPASTIFAVVDSVALLSLWHCV